MHRSEMLPGNIVIIGASHDDATGVIRTRRSVVWAPPPFECPCDSVSQWPVVAGTGSWPLTSAHWHRTNNRRLSAICPKLSSPLRKIEPSRIRSHTRWACCPGLGNTLSDPLAFGKEHRRSVRTTVNKVVLIRDAEAGDEGRGRSSRASFSAPDVITRPPPRQN